VNREQVRDWVRGYERAWRSPGTELLRELFTEDAPYRLSPYSDPETGAEAIAAMWERERSGPSEVFEMTSEVFAVDGDSAVVTVEVQYREPDRSEEFRDIWLLRFEEGRCTQFEEWAFWPEKPYTAPAS
jgi:ketosteroid isomerase-like protein